MVVDIVVIV